MAAVAKEHARLQPSHRRLEAAVRGVFAAAISDRKIRLAAVRTLALRLLNDLQDELLVDRLGTVLTSVHARSGQVGSAQLGSAAELDATGHMLAEIARLTAFERHIGYVITIVVDQPSLAAEAAAGLGEELDQLRPYLDEQLIGGLAAARAALQPLLPAQRPVASRPLAEMDMALSEGRERLESLNS